MTNAEQVTSQVWKTHRYPRSIYGPKGVSYYSCDVTPTEYLAVKRDGGEWLWEIFTIRNHDTYGRAKRLNTGLVATLAIAKESAVRAWGNMRSNA